MSIIPSNRAYLTLNAALRTCFIVATVLSVFLLMQGCKNENSPATTSTNKPLVTGCDTVSYQGTTWNLGSGSCSGGVSSYDVTITQNGKTAKFHITCQNGCIKSATVIP